MAMFKRSTKSAKGFDWAGLGWLFLFFWYFSGITQLLIQLTGTSGFSRSEERRVGKECPV